MPPSESKDLLLLQNVERSQPSRALRDGIRKPTPSGVGKRLFKNPSPESASAYGIPREGCGPNAQPPNTAS